MKRTKCGMDVFVRLRDGTGEICMCTFDTIVMNTFAVFEPSLVNGNGRHIYCFFLCRPKNWSVQHFNTDQDISAATVSTTWLDCHEFIVHSLHRMTFLVESHFGPWRVTLKTYCKIFIKFAVDVHSAQRMFLTFWWPSKLSATINPNISTCTKEICKIERLGWGFWSGYVIKMVESVPVPVPFEQTTLNSNKLKEKDCNFCPLYII